MASQAQPALWRETVKAGAVRSGALIAAAAIAAVTLALALALASYHPADPAINTASGSDRASRSSAAAGSVATSATRPSPRASFASSLGA